MTAATNDARASDRDGSPDRAGRGGRRPRSITMWTDRNTSSGLFGTSHDADEPAQPPRGS